MGCCRVVRGACIRAAQCACEVVALPLAPPQPDGRPLAAFKSSGRLSRGEEVGVPSHQIALEQRVIRVVELLAVGADDLPCVALGQACFG